MENDVPELYVYKKQTGFSKNDSGLILSLPYGIEYSHDTHRNVNDFSLYNIIGGLFMFYCDQSFVGVECDGKVRELSHLESHDSLFGMPKIIVNNRFFTRRLYSKEIATLQKRIDVAMADSSLAVQLLSSRV